MISSLPAYIIGNRNRADLFSGRASTLLITFYVSHLYVTELYCPLAKLIGWMKGYGRQKANCNAHRADLNADSANRGLESLIKKLPEVKHARGVSFAYMIRQGYPPYIFTVSSFTLDKLEEANATVYQLLLLHVRSNTFKSDYTDPFRESRVLCC